MTRAHTGPLGALTRQSSGLGTSRRILCSALALAAASAAAAEPRVDRTSQLAEQLVSVGRWRACQPGSRWNPGSCSTLTFRSDWTYEWHIFSDTNERDWRGRFSIELSDARGAQLLLQHDLWRESQRRVESLSLNFNGAELELDLRRYKAEPTPDAGRATMSKPMEPVRASDLAEDLLGRWVSVSPIDATLYATSLEWFPDGGFEETFSDGCKAVGTARPFDFKLSVRLQPYTCKASYQGKVGAVSAQEAELLPVMLDPPLLWFGARAYVKASEPTTLQAQCDMGMPALQVSWPRPWRSGRPSVATVTLSEGGPQVFTLKKLSVTAFTTTNASASTDPYSWTRWPQKVTLGQREFNGEQFHGSTSYRFEVPLDIPKAAQLYVTIDLEVSTPRDGRRIERRIDGLVRLAR